MLIDENITTRGQYEAEMARLTGTVPICIPEIPGIRDTALELMGVQIGKYEPEPEDAGKPG